ncbi:MAG: S-methyl thiohydantoin desulfurase domain-containing protein [Candidatus Bathyarchaeia archaeon]
MTRDDVEALAIGGAILGGGGGGWYEDGKRDGLLALELGEVELLDPNRIDEEFMVITTAALGAPTQRGETKPRHFIRSVELLKESGFEFDGIIAAENGGHNSFGGWIQGAALGLPIVDAPCDGRAHPTAMMGGMGLHREEGYTSVKAIVAEGIEVIAIGTMEKTSNLARMVAGGVKALVALARDPVTVGYALEHGAPGAISKAIDLGRTVLKVQNKDPSEIVKAALKYLGGEIVVKGRVIEKILEAKGGFDVGVIKVMGDGDLYEVSYMNEYMTLERGEDRIATFPDLICTFGADGLPLTSASVKLGDEIFLTKTSKELVPIGDGNRYSEIYDSVENALGKPMVKYLKGFLKG